MAEPVVVRIALIGSGTIRHVPELLADPLAAHGIAPQWYVGKDGQYWTEALEESSALYAFNPEVTVIAVDALALQDKQADGALSLLSSLAETVAARTQGLVLLHNLDVPSYSPLGILESKQPVGRAELVRQINQQLAQHFRDHPRVFVVDYDGVLSRMGKDQARDDRLYYLADMHLSPAIWRRLGQEYARYVLALKWRVKKCVVLDLDNTLWGGVVGEDGPEGVQLGAAAPGNAYVAFQRALLALHERGVLLAINSHNNAEDALKVIREHPAMVLREAQFAAIRINWDDKAGNLRAIAEELNIGLDSLVYLDDDPAQRWLIHQQLPEVTIVDLPADPSDYVAALQNLVGLDALQLTAEDKRRGELYAAERQRRAFHTHTPSIEEFLVGLNIEVRLKKADKFSLPRLAQLTQRTNQFHATSDRFTEADLERWLAGSGRALYAVEVQDRFGDQGISGAVGVASINGRWDVELLLLSCRVLGRRVEHAVLGALTAWAKARGAQELSCGYVPTEKNGLVRTFLEETGFAHAQGGGARQQWRLRLDRAPTAPDFIRVQTG